MHNKKITHWCWFGLIEFALLGGMVATAQTKAVNGEPSWFEHLDLVQVIIALLLSIVGFFLVRTLSKIDQNQSILTADLKQLDNRLSHLEGEHSALQCRYGRRRDDD